MCVPSTSSTLMRCCFFVCFFAIPILLSDLLAGRVTLDDYKLLKQSFHYQPTRAALTFPIHLHIHLTAACF